MRRKKQELIKIKKIWEEFEKLSLLIEKLDKIEKNHRFDEIIDKKDDLDTLSSEFKDYIRCHSISSSQDELNYIEERLDNINNEIRENIDPLTINLLFSIDKVAREDWQE